MAFYNRSVHKKMEIGLNSNSKRKSNSDKPRVKEERFRKEGYSEIYYVHFSYLLEIKCQTLSS